MRKPSNVQITPSVAQAHLDRLMQKGFAMARSELECGSDQELADRCGLPESYRHYLSLRRPWPSIAMCQVAAATGRHLSAFLVAAEAQP